ncbi:hypothetical protein [Prochlorococcus sp. MIT 1341]|uniref:hypothetical protein n=1 Tax=Prochlorococcus sp. MIT 1341 TaxID=3096221 RepID=UPI002A759DD7|nr:hypothetical protein [Prochlorococcus sp. MIT 1341]
MDDKNWKEEYKAWKTLSTSQILLLEHGAKSLSQSWLLNEMWCEWKGIKKLKETELPSLNTPCRDLNKDPWE